MRKVKPLAVAVLTIAMMGLSVPIEAAPAEPTLTVGEPTFVDCRISARATWGGQPRRVRYAHVMFTDVDLERIPSEQGRVAAGPSGDILGSKNLLTAGETHSWRAWIFLYDRKGATVSYTSSAGTTDAPCTSVSAA